MLNRASITTNLFVVFSLIIDTPAAMYLQILDLMLSGNRHVCEATKNESSALEKRAI